MPKITVDYDEWYPVYYVSKSGRHGLEVELSEEDVAFIAKAYDDFEKAHEMLRTAYHEKHNTGP